MAKMLYEVGKDLADAWKIFILEFCYSIKINYICNFFEKIITNFTSKKDYKDDYYYNSFDDFYYNEEFNKISKNNSLKDKMIR